MKKLIAIIVAFVVLAVGAKALLDSQSKSAFEQSTLDKPVVSEQVDEVEVEQTNKETPAIEVYDMDGNKKTFEDFKNKPILINFWSSRCTPCKEEMPAFQKAYEKYKDDYHFVMISAIGALGETEKSAKKFIEKNNYTFPVYLDSDYTSQMNFGIYSIPTTFILHPDLTILRGQMGMVPEDALMTALDAVLQEVNKEKEQA